MLPLKCIPLVRVLVIVTLMAVPILLVILPRLGEIRELLKRPKIEVAGKTEPAMAVSDTERTRMFPSAPNATGRTRPTTNSADTAAQR